MDMIRPTKLVVNKNAIKHNIREIQKLVGKNVTVMPVIKARGYGTGIGTAIDIFSDVNVNILAVAVVDEGIGLRKQGFTGEIMILNQPYQDEIIKLLEYDLTPSVCLAEFIEKLDFFAKIKCKYVCVHLEIDTGMGRMGINPDDINKYVNLFKRLKNVKLDGVYTHFSSSDTDENYTLKQIRKFENVLFIIKQNFQNIKYIHACNTAGIINFPQAHYNMVRPGISLYGHLPSEDLKKNINLIPATVLKTKIVYIHEGKAGDCISYNQSYVVHQRIKIATIPIGYADGIMRCYKGKISIKEKLVNILGVINMDSLMLDVTDIDDIKVGTDVYIWNNENITLEDVSKECGTISYEILSRLAPRIVKVFE